jgi:hypothetical protein
MLIIPNKNNDKNKTRTPLRSNRTIYLNNEIGVIKLYDWRDVPQEWVSCIQQNRSATTATTPPPPTKTPATIIASIRNGLGNVDTTATALSATQQDDDERNGDAPRNNSRPINLTGLTVKKLYICGHIMLPELDQRRPNTIYRDGLTISEIRYLLVNELVHPHWKNYMWGYPVKNIHWWSNWMHQRSFIF